jgi:hypothetical protein
MIKVENGLTNNLYCHSFMIKVKNGLKWFSHKFTAMKNMNYVRKAKQDMTVNPDCHSFMIKVENDPKMVVIQIHGNYKY